MGWLTTINWPGWNGLFEIAVLAVGFYFAFMLFRETPGAQVFTGLVLLIMVLLGFSHAFRMDALNWILRRLSVYLAVALIVIFQPEIRRALAELGKQHVFSSPAEPRSTVESVVQAVVLLAERRVGALIAIEREISTGAIQDTGVKLDSRVASELLASIFYPHTPLHDGGVIIRENRIVAAGCLFPLSQRPELSKSLGTRHRAAIGLTEETDAVAVIVSEETGTISVSYRGRLSRGMDEERLRRFLAGLLLRSKTVSSPWGRARERLTTALRGLARPANRRSEESADGR
jgi:diadenylate cyclase